MTENEAMKNLETLERFYRIAKSGSALHEVLINFVTLEDLVVAIKALSEIQQYRAIGTVGEVRMLKDYKELYDVYKLIGTIEEFRNLKYKKNVLPIATIKISKEDMQKIVDEKVAQIELNIQKIRAKAIDEFVEEIRGWKGDIHDNEYDADKYDFVFERIFEIAEQMKAGGKSEVEQSK